MPIYTAIYGLARYGMSYYGMTFESTTIVNMKPTILSADLDNPQAMPGRAI